MKNSVRVSSIIAASALVLVACAGGEPPPSSFPGLTLDGNTAYLASNLHIYKFDAATGKEAWRFPVTQDNANPRGPFGGPPVKVGNLIIVGGTIGNAGAADKHIYGLSDADGSEKWRWESPNATSIHREFVDGVVAEGTVIFAASGDGNLYALDVSSDRPQVKWTFTTQNKLWARPLVAEGTVYQPALDHNLYIIDAVTGKEISRFTAGASLASTPALADGVLYFGSFDQKVYAIDKASGKKLWETDRLDGWFWCEPLVVGNTVFIGDVKGKLYALDAKTGKTRWAAQTGGAIRAKPVAVGNTLYFQSFDSFLYSVELNATPDGNGAVTPKRVFENGLGRRLLSTPGVNDGTLLIPLFDGETKVTAIRLEDNTRLYDYPPKPAQ
jgi:outer membrane protein assembly factor BamB